MARVGMVVYDGIGPMLDLLAFGAVAHTMSVLESGAETVEYYAQTNAPWTDRTGMARAGLTASVYEDDGVVGVELAHSVDYGYWLEVIQDGEYAIIMPTLEVLGPEILRQAGAGVVTIQGALF